jgi:cytosine permease
VTYAVLANAFGATLGAEEPTVVNAAEAEGMTKPATARSVVA